MRAQPVRPQVQHLLLELVLHVTPRAVQLLIQSLGHKTLPVLFAWEPLGGQVSHHETRIVSRGHHFGLADHSPAATPTALGPIFKLSKHPHTGRTTQTPTRPCIGQGQGQLLD